MNRKRNGNEKDSILKKKQQNTNNGQLDQAPSTN